MRSARHPGESLIPVAMIGMVVAIDQVADGQLGEFADFRDELLGGIRSQMRVEHADHESVMTNPALAAASPPGRAIAA